MRPHIVLRVRVLYSRKASYCFASTTDNFRGDVRPHIVLQERVIISVQDVIMLYEYD